MKDCPQDASERPNITEFLGEQRRFGHLVGKDKVTGEVKVKPGQEENMAKRTAWVQGNVDRMYSRRP